MLDTASSRDLGLFMGAFSLATDHRDCPIRVETFDDDKREHSISLVIFNNYSPKAKLILLNNPRDEVEGIIQQY